MHFIVFRPALYFVFRSTPSPLLYGAEFPFCYFCKASPAPVPPHFLPASPLMFSFPVCAPFLQSKKKPPVYASRTRTSFHPFSPGAVRATLCYFSQCFFFVLKVGQQRDQSRWPILSADFVPICCTMNYPVLLSPSSVSAVQIPPFTHLEHGDAASPAFVSEFPRDCRSLEILLFPRPSCAFLPAISVFFLPLQCRSCDLYRRLLILLFPTGLPIYF